MSATLRWLIWLVYLVVWTAVLVFPVPEQLNSAAEEILHGRKYYFAKGLHIGAYAVLTILSGWLRAPAGYRVLLIAFIMVHGLATELIQLRVSSRSGTLDDVGFDHLGVFLGLALSWKWWRESA